MLVFIVSGRNPTYILSEYPKSTAELKIHNGIYQYLTPLILDEIINNRNDRQTLFNTYELVKASYLVNDNYTPMKFAQDEVSSGLHIPYKTVAEYFDKTDYYIRSYLRKCIQYLHDMSCVIFKEVFIIKRVTYLTNFAKWTQKTVSKFHMVDSNTCTEWCNG